MPCLIDPRPEQLPNLKEIPAPEDPLDFPRARALADRAAVGLLPNPLLLAWYNREQGEFSPNIVCCQEEQPSWLVYAKSRGAALTLSLDGGRYLFLYRSGLE